MFAAHLPEDSHGLRTPPMKQNPLGRGNQLAVALELPLCQPGQDLLEDRPGGEQRRRLVLEHQPTHAPLREEAFGALQDLEIPTFGVHLEGERLVGSKKVQKYMRPNRCPGLRDMRGMTMRNRCRLGRSFFGQLESSLRKHTILGL